MRRASKRINEIHGPAGIKNACTKEKDSSVIDIDHLSSVA